MLTNIAVALVIALALILVILAIVADIAAYAGGGIGNRDRVPGMS